MDKYEPKYLIHGHVHQEYTHKFVRERSYNKTTVVNACGKYIFEIEAPAVQEKKPSPLLGKKKQEVQ